MLCLRTARPIVVWSILGAVLVASASPAHAQFGKILPAAGCAAAGFLGYKLGGDIGDKVAEFEVKRRGISGAEAERIKTGFKVGMTLALCGAGAALGKTTYSKLSKRGKAAREKELVAALEDAEPHTYLDPDRPTLRGTATAQPAFIDGQKECRVVEDYLADGGQTDFAMVRYCRPSAGGPWKVDNL